MDQRVKVQSVRLPGRPALKNFPAITREQCFPHRVTEQQQRKPGRNGGIALDKQDRQLGDQEAYKVRPAISKEYQATRVVEDEKAQQRSSHDEAKRHYGFVAYLASHVNDRR